MSEDVINYNGTDFRSDIDGFFTNDSKIVNSVLRNAGRLLCNLEKYLYTAPAMINLVKASIPVSAYQAVFTSDQFNRLAQGSIKLMSDRNGRTLAKLVDAKTHRIISNVELKEVDFTPDISQALTGFALQMQIMMLSEKLDAIQETTKNIFQGQENDRLALAEACRDNLEEALAMNDETLRKTRLVAIANDINIGRKQLFKSQEQIISKILSFKGSFISYFRSWGGRTKTIDIDEEIGKLRTNLSATVGVSMVAGIAYEELNEMDSARISFQKLSDFMEATYLSRPGFVDKLDLLDPYPDNFWSTQLVPVINQINKLPDSRTIDYL